MIEYTNYGVKRMDFWADTFQTSIMDGHGVRFAAQVADDALQEFDKRFPPPEKVVQ